MTDIVYDMIAGGVDLIFMSAMLASVILLLRSGIILTSMSSAQQDNANRTVYYKPYYIYDNKDNLASADALSVLLKNRSEVFTMVDIGKPTSGVISTHNYIINNINTGEIYNIGNVNPINYDYASNSSKKISSEELRELLESDYIYHSYIYEDGSEKNGIDKVSMSYSGGVISAVRLSRTK